MPRAVMERDIANLRQLEATPLAPMRQAPLALPAKLIGQSDLLPVGVAEDVRTELTGITVVGAKDLLSCGDGLDEQLVDSAWHRVSRSVSSGRQDRGSGPSGWAS